MTIRFGRDFITVNEIVLWQSGFQSRPLLQVQVTCIFISLYIPAALSDLKAELCQD